MRTHEVIATARLQRDATRVWDRGTGLCQCAPRCESRKAPGYDHDSNPHDHRSAPSGTFSGVSG
jgi:hypothetical protein